MIVAKTVVPNQYWILRQGEHKIGNIEAEPDGFRVKINNSIEKFKTIQTIKRRVDIDFEPVIRTKRPDDTNAVNGYPTTGRPYNAIFDVRHQVPLWTQEPRSKSWYAAGWYRVKHGRAWAVVQCPKLITLERYQYQGPFRTETEAQQA